MCFTGEKEHYELPSDSTRTNYFPEQRGCQTQRLEYLMIGVLNNWRNEFAWGIRQQSVRNSFTKNKAGTLLFYMYTSVNLDTEPDETSHDLAEATVQELFKSVSSTRSTQETYTPTPTIHNQLQYLQQVTVILVT